VERKVFDEKKIGEMLWVGQPAAARWLLTINSLMTLLLLTLMPMIPWLHLVTYEAHMTDPLELLTMLLISEKNAPKRKAKPIGSTALRGTGSPRVVMGTPASSPEARDFDTEAEQVDEDEADAADFLERAKRRKLQPDERAAKFIARERPLPKLLVERLVRLQETKLIGMRRPLKVAGWVLNCLEVVFLWTFFQLQLNVETDRIAGWTGRHFPDIRDWSLPFFMVGLALTAQLGFRIATARQHKQELPHLSVYEGAADGLKVPTVLAYMRSLNRYTNERRTNELSEHLNRETEYRRTQTFRPFLMIAVYFLCLLGPWAAWTIFYRAAFITDAWFKLTGLYFGVFVFWALASIRLSSNIFWTAHELHLLAYLVNERLRREAQSRDLRSERRRIGALRIYMDAWVCVVKGEGEYVDAGWGAIQAKAQRKRARKKAAENGVLDEALAQDEGFLNLS